MEKRITFTIGPPISVNRMYVPSKRYGMVKSKKYRNWIEQNIELVKSIEKPKNFPIDLEVTVFIGRGFTDKSDIDNVLKAVADLLVKSEIIPDDNINYIRKCEAKFMDYWKKTSPATTVITIVEPF